MQVLVVALAGLLLLERWQRRHELAPVTTLDDEADAPIDFHPELIMRWDDEADYARPTPCTRPATPVQRPLARPLAAASRPHTHIR